MTDKKEVGLFAGGVSLKADADKMAKALKNAAQDNERGQLPEGGVYISFSGKIGKYSIGEDKADADPDELWLVNVFSFEKGWMCWKGARPVAKRLSSIYGPDVEAPDFTEHGPFDTNRGEGWSKAKSMMLRSIDTGVQGQFSTSTKSAVNEFATLEDKVAKRIENGEPFWPLIYLKKETFQGQGQTNWKPELEVFAWLGTAQIEKMAKYEDHHQISENLDSLIEDAEEGITKYPELDIGEETTSDDEEVEGYVGEEADNVEDAEVVEEKEEKKERKEATRSRRPANKDESMRRRRRRA